MRENCRDRDVYFWSLGSIIWFGHWQLGSKLKTFFIYFTPPLSKLGLKVGLEHVILKICSFWLSKKMLLND